MVAFRTIRWIRTVSDNRPAFPSNAQYCPDKLAPTQEQKAAMKMQTGPDHAQHNPTTNARTVGWILIAGATLSLGFAMAHPQLTAHELNAVLRQMIAGATFNGWVHGILMALYVILAAGLLGFSRLLGLDRPLVSLGMVAYGVGIIAMVGAAVINGFALSLFAGRYAAVKPEQANAVAASINAMGSISGAWAGVGAVASSMAILVWSVTLLRFGGGWRVAGVIGMAIGAATSVMLISGTIILNVHGFMLLIFSQSIWIVAIGYLLLGGAPNGNALQQ